MFKKTIWRNKGHAKLAILHHFECCNNIIGKFLNCEKCSYAPTEYYYLDKKKLKEFLIEAEKQGILEYVEVDIELYAEQPKT